MLNKKRWSSAVWQILLGLFTLVFLSPMIRSVYKELHADHETGAADNK